MRVARLLVVMTAASLFASTQASAQRVRGVKGDGKRNKQASPSLTQQASQPTHSRATADVSFSGKRNDKRGGGRPDRGLNGGGFGQQPQVSGGPGQGGRTDFGNRPNNVGRPGADRLPAGNAPTATILPDRVERPGLPQARPRPTWAGRPDYVGVSRPDYGTRPVRPDPTFRPVRPQRPDNVNIDQVVNNVSNVTNVTNINNQTVINNFGNHYGDNYVNQNNYEGAGGYHSRPWSTRYDSLHYHWHGGYWNMRYRPRIWVSPSVQVSWGAAPIPRYVFVNPYLAGGTVTYYSGFDYSLPIRPAAGDLNAAITEEAIRRFDAARAEFRDNNYRRCLQLIDSAIQLVPDDSVMHELRALVLFGLGDYETSASIVYAVLGGGPGSDWTTIGGLYANPELYFEQLSQLARFVALNPDRPGPRFLLAYHLLIVGRPDAAYAQFAEVLRRNPQDRVTYELMQALNQTPTQYDPYGG